MDQLELAQGGAKRPHESSYSDKEQLPVGSPVIKNDGHQLVVVGQPLVGGFRLSPRKAKRDGLSPVSSLEYGFVL